MSRITPSGSQQIEAAVVRLPLTGLYGVLAPAVTGTLRTGPPGSDFEIWLASALLAVTFPFLIFIAESYGLFRGLNADSVPFSFRTYLSSPSVRKPFPE